MKRFLYAFIPFNILIITAISCTNAKMESNSENDSIAANNYVDMDSVNAIPSKNKGGIIAFKNWTEIDIGLQIIEFKSQVKSDVGDSIITILRINPEYYNFNLISSKENNEGIMTASQWAKSKDLIAVINAGMYQQDFQTNVGYMKNYDFSNNDHVSKDKTITAFNRKDTTVSEIQIIDMECQNWEEMKDKYYSYTQGIRLIDCNQKNRWSQQDKKWSMVVIGIDKDGNALFIFCRSPYSVHDFIDILLQLPINIYNAMYLEGGPEASFYLNHNGVKIERFGSFETGFCENNDNTNFWPIPNVIGIAKK